MKNIEVFNLAVGEVLGECYDNFPIPAYISRLGIGKAVKEYYPDFNPDYLNLDDYEFEVSKHTIRWLVKAEYIWVSEGYESSNIIQATLSPKGLEVLNVSPTSIDGSNTIGSMLSKGVEAIGVGVFQKLVLQVLSKGSALS